MQILKIKINDNWVEIPAIRGPQGQPPNITIGTVTTLPAGSNAAASITGTTPNLLLNLSIPKGADGDGSGSSYTVPDIDVYLRMGELLQGHGSPLVRGAEESLSFIPASNMGFQSNAELIMTKVILSAGNLQRPAYVMTASGSTPPAEGATVTPTQGRLVWVKLYKSEFDYLQYRYMRKDWSGDYIDTTATANLGNVSTPPYYHPAAHYDETSDSLVVKRADVLLANLKNTLDSSGDYMSANWALSDKTSAELYKGLFTVNFAVWNPQAWYLVQFNKIATQQLDPTQGDIEYTNAPYWSFSFVTSSGTDFVTWCEELPDEGTIGDGQSGTVVKTASYTGEYVTGSTSNTYIIRKTETITHCSDNDLIGFFAKYGISLTVTDWWSDFVDGVKELLRLNWDIRATLFKERITFAKPTGATGLSIFQIQSFAEWSTTNSQYEMEQSGEWYPADNWIELVDGQGYKVDSWDDAISVVLQTSVFDMALISDFTYFWHFGDGARSVYLRSLKYNANHPIPIGTFAKMPSFQEVENFSQTQFVNSLTVSGAASAFNQTYVRTDEFSCGSPVFKYMYSSGYYAIKKMTDVIEEGKTHWVITDGQSTVMYYSEVELDDGFTGTALASNATGVTVTKDVTVQEETVSGEESGSSIGYISEIEYSRPRTPSTVTYYQVTNTPGTTKFAGIYTDTGETKNNKPVYSNGVCYLYYGTATYKWTFGTSKTNRYYYNKSDIITDAYTRSNGSSPVPTVVQVTAVVPGTIAFSGRTINVTQGVAMEAAVELQASASNNAPVTFSAANVPSGITVTSDGYIYGTFSGSENATMSVTASAAGCPDVTVSIVFSVTASGSGSGSGSGEGGEGGESGGSGSGEGGGGGGVALYVEGIQALKWDYSYLTGTYNLISGTHGTTTAVYRRTDSQYWIMYRGQWDIVDNAEGDGPAEDSNNGTLVTDNYWEHCSVTVN